jgi:uncharacterized protein YqjF (DUF2071 family)
MKIAAVNSSRPSLTASEAARRRMVADRGEPFMMADWNEVVFLHYEVEPALLQREVPFSLDRWDGRAFVSVVSFTMSRLRLPRLGRLGEWMLRPIGTHPFLNVRTYVQHRGESGIVFLTEWMTNPISVKFGGPMFGLPYRLGRAAIQNAIGVDLFPHGEISDSSGARLRYEVVADRERSGPAACFATGLDAFLLERYTCFTAWKGLGRYFRVWHQPWDVVSGEARVQNDGLLELTGAWITEAALVRAHVSRGVSGVWMGRPHFTRI